MIRTFGEVRAQARAEKRAIIETVLRADDSIERIAFGPRGGWRPAPRTDFENACPRCGPTCEC